MVSSGVIVANHYCSTTPSACNRFAVVAEPDLGMRATMHSTLYPSFIFLCGMVRKNLKNVIAPKVNMERIEVFCHHLKIKHQMIKLLKQNRPLNTLTSNPLTLLAAVTQGAIYITHIMRHHVEYTTGHSLGRNPRSKRKNDGSERQIPKMVRR